MHCSAPERVSIKSSGYLDRGRESQLRVGNLEKRLLQLALGLTIVGTILTWIFFGTREGLSFLAGALLAAGDLAWLRASLGGVFSRDPKRAKPQVLAGFFLRLLLIPLCLYVMIRFLFLNLLAAVAGFAIFLCSVFVEGILEAFGSSPR